MTKVILTAALLLSVQPAFAQTKPLTPPDVLGAAKTIQFTATAYEGSGEVKLSTAMLVQPNKARFVDTNPKTKVVEIICTSDGESQTEYRALTNRYIKSTPGGSLSALSSNSFSAHFVAVLLSPKNFADFHHLSSDAPGVYEIPLGTQEGTTRREVLTVNPATGLPQSLKIAVSAAGQPDSYPEKILFTGWKLNAPINKSQFVAALPADAKPFVMPQVLADGTAAPDFTVQDKDGKAVRLSDYKGKTVVLDFWATWCGPCQSSLPHTTEMAKKYADKNVVVLAVNVWDTPAAFQAWLPKHPEYAPVHFAIDPNPTIDLSVATALYGVNGIPTQYIIGTDGKIVKSIVGFDSKDTRLEDALKTATVGTGN